MPNSIAPPLDGAEGQIDTMDPSAFTSWNERLLTDLALALRERPQVLAGIEPCLRSILQESKADQDAAARRMNWASRERSRRVWQRAANLLQAVEDAA
jgi:hypothetical protein